MSINSGRLREHNRLYKLLGDNAQFPLVEILGNGDVSGVIGPMKCEVCGVSAVGVKYVSILLDGGLKALSGLVGASCHVEMVLEDVNGDLLSSEGDLGIGR